MDLGRIESTILKHPAVKGCYTRMLPVNKNLACIAYFVPAYQIFDEDGIVNDIKTFLNLFLPRHMVPRFFVKIDRFPLTMHGTIDKNQLPLPDHSSDQKFNDVSSATLMERRVIDIIGKIIPAKCIHIDDNIFELCINGLKTVDTVILNLNESLKAGITMPILFKNPTVRTISAYMDTREEEDEPEELLCPFSLIKKGTGKVILLLPGIDADPEQLLNFAKLDFIPNPIYVVTYPTNNNLSQFDGIMDYVNFLIGHFRLIPAFKEIELIGTGFGTSVALEMAIQLQRNGVNLSRLTSLGSALPSGQTINRPFDFIRSESDTFFKSRFFEKKTYVKHRIPFLIRTFHHKITTRKHTAETGDRPNSPCEASNLMENYRPQHKFNGDVILVFSRELMNPHSRLYFRSFILEKLWKKNIVGKVKPYLIERTGEDLFSYPMLLKIATVLVENNI